MTNQLNNNVFDQLTASSDYTRQTAALVAMMVHGSEQSFGLGWPGQRQAENGERKKNMSLTLASIRPATESGGSFIESQCKGWLPASKHRAGQKQILSAPGVATEIMEITYRVVLSLMGSEQVTLARKALAALPLDRLGDPMIVRLRKMLAVPVTKTSQKRDTDRTLDYQWIRDHAQDYRGQWVALDKGELLAAAASLRELLDHVKHLKHRPLLHQIS